MSNEKRNISDINDQKTAEQQAFSEEIRRRLAEPGSGKPTLDEFKVMVYKDREKRRKKRNALVACIVAAFIVGYLTYDDLVPEVGADKNPKETIQTEDGVIIEDGGYGSSVGENSVWVIEDWEHISELNKENFRLLVPKYTPPKYEFKLLRIEQIADSDIICNYLFKNKTGKILEIEIITVAGGEEVLNIDNIDKRLETRKGTIYIQDNNEKATMYFNDGIVVNIWYSVSEKELIKIVDEMYLLE